MINVNFDSLDDMLHFANRLAGLGQAGPVTVQTAAQTVKVEPTDAKADTKVESTEKKQDETADTKPDVEADETADTPDKAEKKYTLEEVRAKLAALNKAGKRLEVKTILNSFGVEKLSEIPEDKYQEIMEKAGEV